MIYFHGDILKKQPKQLPKIDLHGLTVQDAFDRCKNRLDLYKENDYKEIEVITGKSGQIRKEFPNWLETWKLTGTVAIHDGSFTVILK